VLEAAVVADRGSVRVDLFEDVQLTGDPGLSVEATAFGARVRFDRPFGGTLALRAPAWAEAAHIVRNGARSPIAAEGGYVRPSAPFAAGEVLELALTPRVRVRTRDRRDLRLPELTDTPIRGGLVVGPYVMAVMEEESPDFFGEPWSGGDGHRPVGNLVRLSSSVAQRIGGGRWPHVETIYEHDGFAGRHPLRLRALGMRPAADQQIHAFWLTVARG
jgi:hypothetical protein